MRRPAKHTLFGFTLLELVVSIGVVGILAAGVVSVIGRGPQRRSRDAQRQADIQKIATALELYRSDRGNYPGTGNLNLLTTPPPTPPGAAAYLNRVPVDPVGGVHVYTYTSNGATYRLCVNLESTPGNVCNEYFVDNP